MSIIKETKNIDRSTLKIKLDKESKSIIGYTIPRKVCEFGETDFTIHN